MKEFKTVDEQILLLESRGVRCGEGTADALRREGYYAIVNGYKDTFLDRDAMQRSPGDVYLRGTTFKMIYDMFLFDRAMRNAVMPSLIEAESTLKNAVVYAFCSEHRGTADYLDRANYVSARDMLVPNGFRGNKAKEHARDLNSLLSRLNNKLTPSKTMKPFTRHYVETYGMVPLWVLQNDLTFGNISHFYQLQKRGIQNAAARSVSASSGAGGRIGAKELLRIFDVLVGFRNICAHDDRLYCASVNGAHFDAALTSLYRILNDSQRARLSVSIEDVTMEFMGRIRPSSLNSMYTDPDDIPEEFREPHGSDPLGR